MGSNGSVIPFFIKEKEKGVIPVTSLEMTRFNISLLEGVKMVINSLQNSWGGEIFVPKLKSYKITDLVKAIAPKCKVEIIGIRPGEKIHEEMITKSDSFNTFDHGKFYTILPTLTHWDINDYIEFFNVKEVDEGFNYSSGNNTSWESVDSLRKLINKHVDIDFKL